MIIVDTRHVVILKQKGGKRDFVVVEKDPVVERRNSQVPNYMRLIYTYIFLPHSLIC